MRFMDLARLSRYQVGAVFGDNMILQREMPIHVWGSADAGEKVTVKFGGNAASTTADGVGSWKVTLPALKEGKALQLVAVGNNAVTLSNVAIGEVWICAVPMIWKWP